MSLLQRGEDHIERGVDVDDAGDVVTGHCGSFRTVGVLTTRPVKNQAPEEGDPCGSEPSWSPRVRGRGRKLALKGSDLLLESLDSGLELQAV